MNIEEICKFQVVKARYGFNDHVMVDPIGLPGIPPTGMGQSELEAKYDCLIKLLETQKYRQIIYNKLTENILGVLK